MSLRRRFLLTFSGLILLGVMAISVYSILFVRGHLLTASRDNLDRQARYLALLLADRTDSTDFAPIITDYARYTGQQVELLDANFHVHQSVGAVADTAAPHFSGIAPLPDAPTTERQYVRVTAGEAEIVDTITKVGLIIGSGIMVALLLTIVVAWVVADKVSQPIRELAGAARKIADGEQATLLSLDRDDEIGDLSRDVAAMAARLQADIHDLKRLTRAQEDFIAAVSHEVRNPVFSARGYLEAALEEVGAKDGEVDRPRLRDLLEKSHRNLMRIHRLFADMLLLVRLEFGEEPGLPARTELAPLMGELEETFLPRAREKGIVLETAGRDLAVTGNSEVIKIVLSNLLSNAIRHTDRGEVRMAAELKDEKVEISVIDTGEGIPGDQLERIFEKFYRIDKARSREQGGTGLGLALVQKCMQALDTRIEVESEPDRGSRFWFVLPAA
ncbi:MAG: HAMP domain-containing sensor histidine kinase [Candidatus Neomarinimicrobiota bacterium]